MAKSKDKKATDKAKAVAHPLRVKILNLLEDGKGPLSPAVMSIELDEPLGNVSYHVKCLLEYEAVKLVKTEPRRGALEHFYTTTGQITAPNRGVMLDRFKAQMAATAIRFALVETEGTENEDDIDAAGWTPEQRAALHELIGELTPSPPVPA